MSIEDKLRSYLNGSTLQASELSVAQAKQHGIRLHKSCVGSTLLEPHGVCASIRLPRGSTAFIGAHSYLNDGGYVKGPVFIGRFGSVGRRVSIGASRHRFDGLSSSPLFNPVQGPAPGSAAFTVLENDVWVGDGAVILEGVRIGTGAVIGANSVVTRDIQAYDIVSGVPAVTRRRRFPAGVIDRLIASAWWNLPVEFLRTLPAHDIGQALSAIEADKPPTAQWANYRPADMPTESL